MQFLSGCINHNVIPNGLKLKKRLHVTKNVNAPTPLVNKLELKCSRILHRAGIDLTRAIRDYYDRLYNETNGQDNEHLFARLISKKCRKLSKLTGKHVAHEELIQISHHPNRRFMRFRNSSKNTSNLVLNPEKFVVNMTKEEFTQDEMMALALGLNFNSMPREFGRCLLLDNIRRTCINCFNDQKVKAARLQATNKMGQRLFDEFAPIHPNYRYFSNIPKHLHDALQRLLSRTELLSAQPKRPIKAACVTTYHPALASLSRRMVDAFKMCKTHGKQPIVYFKIHQTLKKMLVRFKFNISKESGELRDEQHNKCAPFSSQTLRVTQGLQRTISLAHMQFLSGCINHNVIPNGLKLKKRLHVTKNVNAPTPLVNKLELKCSRILHRAGIDLTRAIRDYYDRLYNETNGQDNEHLFARLISKKCRKLSKLTGKHVAHEELIQISHHPNRRFMRFRNSSKNTSNLVLNPEKFVVNMTKEEFTQDEMMALALGLNFNSMPREFGRCLLLDNIRRTCINCFNDQKVKAARLQATNKMGQRLFDEFAPIHPNYRYFSNIPKHLHDALQRLHFLLDILEKLSLRRCQAGEVIWIQDIFMFASLEYPLIAKPNNAKPPNDIRYLGIATYLLLKLMLAAKIASSTGSTTEVGEYFYTTEETRQEPLIPIKPR
ncbi:hypothetical protein GJ496_007500 [Pomphorhynchus laevis]|nr:hypothetical protein GJ496_007500 [Pomphorhynchus laevis]